MLQYGPVLSEHCVRVAGLDPGRNPRAAPLDAGEQAALLQGVRSWEAWLDACETSAPEGFIATRPAGAASCAEQHNRVFADHKDCLWLQGGRAHRALTWLAAMQWQTMACQHP